MLNSISSAAWLGSRIILRQVSPESSSIFDFIIELHRTCSGNWHSFIGEGVSSDDLQKFLTYVATFLSNAGNYYKLADRSSVLRELYEEIHKSIESIPPFNLGFPSETSQSSYYLGNAISESDATIVSKILEQNSVFPENTRLRKSEDGTEYEVLIASVERGAVAQFSLPSDQGHDKAPRVENIFGFVGPYRDPQGIRGEFEALVAIADDSETRLLAELVDNSAKFIRRLPWATQENDGKGPFEKSLFEPPDFSSIHALAYCSSIIFPGINLPNYNDIRQENGFKNVIISNRMIAESQAEQYPFIEDSEAEQFRKHKFQAYYYMDGKFNFDIENPPINPLTGRPISSWYKPGQTWTGQFGELATTVDECRAELVGAYLMDDSELLEMFGFTETSNIHADDLTYNLYLQLGVDGLRGLSNFNVQSNKWGQAHSRAHFAILKCLLLNGGGVITISHSEPKHRLTVQVDRSEIRTRGKPALGKMLLHLHMFRCTADVEGCRTYYEKLSSVDGEYIEWRETVIVNKPPPLVFVQANTFRDGDTITLKEYEPTVEGVIASWVERQCEQQIDLP
ncbi:hypothetical protein MANI_120270 [Metarhizium anisopliae]|nr:hypothetical protein MANI_120270 [Metarhizium anisopliae]